MRRALRVGASLGLALVVLTCTDQPTGVRGRGTAAFDLSPLFLIQPGEPPIPVDSVRVQLHRTSDGTLAFDSAFAVTPPGDSIVIQIAVELRQTTEDFFLTVVAFGAGTTWYDLSATVSLTAGQTSAPAPFTANYVGPGANAVRVVVLPADTTATGGVPFPLRAVVYDAKDVPIAGVPVGYRLSDPTLGAIAYLTPFSATFTGAVPRRDSAWIVAETPTHLKDSTKVHVVPPAATLVMVSGDGQTGVVGGPLPQPLGVRVVDALGGGYKGFTVTWAVTSGTANLSTTSTVTDDNGFASITVTPTVIAPLQVRASAVGLTPASQTFTASVVSGTVAQVIITPKLDTILYGSTRQFTAVLKDQFGNIVNGSPVWNSTVPSVATVDLTGLARGVGGDSTSIIASAAGHADTARLYVRALRSIVVAPADTVVTAVGDSFALRATAYDNFGAVLTTGFTQTFVSASPSVVTVNATTGRTRSVGPGNGVVVVRDSVDPSLKAQGTVTVRVNQVTVGIQTLPTRPESLKVGVNGRGQIVAHARDRNGYQIPGKAFAFVSRDPAVAAVDGSGLVTGLQLNGTVYVIDSLADSAGTFKDSVLVAVVPAPPALLQWGFDSLSVGNGGNVSVPLTLSRTDPGALTVLLTSSDTLIARAATGCPGTVLKKIQIPANTSATSVLLCGLAAGRVTLVAQDSAGIFLPDTMVVTVVSTIEFREIGQFSRQQYFYVNQNETHRAQVFLSDPAPAGGLGVTFVYGRAGTSSAAPAPAIIPAGQLSANVMLQGLAPGTDSVVPTSGGLVGKFSYLYVAPDSLKVSVPYPYAVGVGQTMQPYVYYTYAMDHPLIVSLGIAPAIGTAPDTVTVPTNSYYRYFEVRATGVGTATVTASAPGWVAGSGAVTFTTPQLGTGGAVTMIGGDPSKGSWYAYTQDSIGRYSHPVVDTVVVTATSRDPTVVAVDVTVGKVVPGQSSVSISNGLRAVPGAGGQSTWIVLTAPGYRPDSFLVNVTAPALSFSLSYPYQVLVGGRFTNAVYLSIPYVRPDSFTVVFQHSRRGIVSGPDSVTIPKGQTYVYTDIVGDTLGQDTISVSRATGYTIPAAAVFNVVPLHVSINNQPSTLYTISQPQLVNVYVHQETYPYYSNNLVAPLRVNLVSSNPSAFTLDSAAVTIPVGASVSNVDTLRVPVAAPGNDSGRVLISAPGSTNDSSNIIRVLPTPLTLYVPYPQLVGYHLKLQNGYVLIPSAAPDTVLITLARRFPLTDSLNTFSVKIPPGQSSSGYFDVIGLDSTGTDTITATATGYVPSSGAVTAVPAQVDVQDIGTGHLTTEPPYRVSTYVRMRPYPYYGQIALDTVPFSIVSTDSSVIQIDSAATVSPTLGSGTAFVAPGQSTAYFRIRFVGSGTARIVVSSPVFGTDTMAPVNVIGPSLHLASQNITVGVGQIFQNQSVYVDNAVTVTPLAVTLQRSDSGLARPAFGLSTTGLTIPVGQTTSQYFNITGDTIGSAQLIARATGYGQVTTTVQVGPPQLIVPTTQALYVGQVPQQVTVYTADHANNGRVVAADLVVNQTTSDPAVAVGDSASRTIVAGQFTTSFNFRGLKFGSVSAIFTAAGYKADTMVVSVDTGQIAFSSVPSTVGPGQTAPMEVYLPFTNDSAMTVHLASSLPSVLTAPDSVIIPARTAYVYFDVTGVATGTAAVTATAPGKAKPATSPGITVGPPKLQLFFAANTIVGQKSTLTVYAEDSVGTARNVATPLRVTLTSSDPTHTTYDSSTITILPNTYYASTGITFTQAGSYTITGAAPGYVGANTTSSATGALVTIADFSFTPTPVTIAAGQYVTWKNTGPSGHTTTSDTPNWNSGTLGVGQTYSMYFGTAGTYTYHCNIHQAMTGTVNVTP